MLRTTVLALSFVTLAAGSALADGKLPQFETQDDPKPVAAVQDEQSVRGEHNTRVGAYGISTENVRRQFAVVPETDRHEGGR